MKTKKVMLAVAAGSLLLNWSQPALANLYTFTGPNLSDAYTTGPISPSQLIPDNSPVGVGYGFNFTTAGLNVSDITLTINLSGGFNGDMYGYLQHNGTLVELITPTTLSANAQVGSTINISLASGFQAALSSATAVDLAQGGLTFAAVGNFNNFVGMDAAGLWTLYFADHGAGDQMTLNSFTLSMTAIPVPEPQTWAMLGGGFAVLLLFRKRRTI